MKAAGLPEPDFQFDDFFTIALKRVYTSEQTIAVSLEVSPKRLERMIFLLKEFYNGNEIDFTTASEKFKVSVNNFRKDLLLLEEKGWLTGSGTTRNRHYSLTKQARENLGNDSTSII